MNRIEQEYPELVEQAYSFDRGGIAIPGNRRPLWRIGLLVQLLANCSRGKKSSFVRLQILDWCSRTKTDQTLMTLFLNNEPSDAAVRLDPATLRAVHYGTALKIFDFDGKTVQLGKAGAELAREIEESGTFEREKAFMESIGKRFLEKQVSQFIGTG